MDLDFLLRLAFLAVAPPLVARLAEIYPMTGALTQIALSIAWLFVGETARARVARSRVARLVFSGQIDFEEHYARHPPRPFYQYLLLPILLPYWLAVPAARRELWLYKGYTLVSLGVLLVSLLVQFALAFPPQLGPREFWPIALRTLVVETVVVLMFLMPLATTFVRLHREGSRWRLAVVVVVGLASAGWALAKIHSLRDPIVSWATRQRVILRTKADERGAEQAQAEGLRAAWRALPTEPESVEIDGKVVGPALEAAQEAMTGFYMGDEANAFDVWQTKSGKRAILVVYFETWKGRPPIWLALEGGKTVTHDPKQLPKGAFDAMWRATQ